MQNSRYSYAHGGLSSLKEARDLLHRHAPEGEHLAYINPREASLLKAHGGSGEMTESGIRSYGLLKKIFKPVAKVLDKIVPNEIKPALPFLAAAAPFLAPGLIGGIGGLFTTNPALAGAIGSGVLNVGSQAAQEGAAKRGLNLGSLALSSLGGALSNPGIDGGMSSSDYFGSLKATGVPTSLTGGTGEFLTNSPFGLNVLSGADPNLAYGVSNVLPTVDTSGYTLSNLDKIQNVATSSAQKAAEFIDKGRAGLESEGIFNTDFLKAAAPGQIGAVADKAYAAAQDAKIKYDEQMAQIGQTVAKGKSDQIYFIRQAMQSAGFTDDEISNALTRSGFADGGSSNKPQPMPINPELLAVAIFGKRLDELTSTQKNALNDYIDVPKKAKGGLMSLGGHEMDFRAAGGFVPIGKKERADDVPARLSKNEFVFTAKAVRNAGNGDIKKGAKKMYQIMKQLEAKA
jgi:hypothetical protein